ncbi:MAG: hypothetical protein ABIR94_09825 [Rubrivivax sp.]
MKAHFYTVARPMVQLSVFCGLALGFSVPAHAVDGCKLLLCMAGNWTNIAECVPTVRQALRDVARGRAWPQCAMASGSGSANQYVAPEQCPEQYRTSSIDWRDQLVYSCPFAGVIHVAVAGQPWSRAWWSSAGDTVIEWLPAARAAYADSPQVMDGQFDRDRAAWAISE